MCDLSRKLQEWKNWWSGDNENSIRNQIFHMMWNASIFEIVKTAHNRALEDGRESPIPNPVIASAILNSYLEGQVAAISRLLDKRSDVISLKRLVKDIQERRPCLTREKILELLELPYNPEDVNAGSPKGIASELAHERMDNLADKSKNERQPTDTIKEEVLRSVEKRLDGVDLKAVHKYRHKFVAHAATHESCNAMNAQDFGITWGRISEAQKILCETAAFVVNHILGDSCKYFVPHGSQGVLDNLDRPFITKEEITALHTRWEAYMEETKKWANWNWKR